VEKLYVNIVAQKVVLEGVPERVEGRGLRPIFSVILFISPARGVFWSGAAATGWLMGCKIKSDRAIPAPRTPHRLRNCLRWGLSGE